MKIQLAVLGVGLAVIVVTLIGITIHSNIKIIQSNSYMVLIMDRSSNLPYNLHKIIILLQMNLPSLAIA